MYNKQSVSDALAYLASKSIATVDKAIETAISSKDYCGQAPADRIRRGRNDTIFERLDVTFTFSNIKYFFKDIIFN